MLGCGSPCQYPSSQGLLRSHLRAFAGDVTTTAPAPNATPTAQPASEIGPAHPRALGATIGVGALVFGIVESAERGWTNPMVLVSLVVAVVVLVALVRHERAAEQPKPGWGSSR